MALDGAFLHTIKNEIEEKALGSRIDRIYEPSREEICLLLRSRGWSGKLLMSAGADSPRIHLPPWRSRTRNPRRCSVCCCASTFRGRS